MSKCGFDCSKSCISQGSKKPPAKSSKGPMLWSTEISMREWCPKSPGESSVGPRTRNGISRWLGDIAVLVQSSLPFLTFTNLCLQGQTVSDYHPLFLILGQYLLFKNLKKFFGCILGRSRSCIPKELPTEECPILVPSFGHRGPDEVMQSIYWWIKWSNYRFLDICIYILVWRRLT